MTSESHTLSAVLGATSTARGREAHARWTRLREGVRPGVYAELIADALAAAEEVATAAGFEPGTDDWSDMALEALFDGPAYQTHDAVRVFVALHDE